MGSGLHSFLRQMDFFLTDMSNRVEHQKLSQIAACRERCTTEGYIGSKLHGFSRKLNHLFSSKSSWTPKTQPNDALRRRLVEFLVFNSAFGRHRHWWIPITSYSFIIIDMSFIIYQLLESDPTWQVGSLSSESIDDMTMMMNEYDMIGINQCLCLPKAELNTKNSTKRRRKASFGWVFGVQLDLLEKKWFSLREKPWNMNHRKMIFWFLSLKSMCFFIVEINVFILSSILMRFLLPWKSMHFLHWICWWCLSWNLMCYYKMKFNVFCPIMHWVLYWFSVIYYIWDKCCDISLMDKLLKYFWLNITLNSHPKKTLHHPCRDTKDSTKRQQICRLFEFLVFKSVFGWCM